MADLKISQLSSATALAGTEVVPVVQGGATKKATIDQILTPAAGKGVDFSANTGTAGSTKELLDWYEEGNWTPNQGTGLTVVGAFSATGKYTRIGRQVTVTARFAGATSISCAAFGQLCSNLPYTSGATAYSGAAWGGAGPTSNVCVCSYDVLYLIDAATAGSNIDITLTYFV